MNQMNFEFKKNMVLRVDTFWQIQSYRISQIFRKHQCIFILSTLFILLILERNVILPKSSDDAVQTPQLTITRIDQSIKSNELIAGSKSPHSDSTSQSQHGQSLDSAIRDFASPPTDPRFDIFAVALKTGQEVALERTPIQLLTFLSPLKNVIVIGDAALQIGRYSVIDVYTHLYDGLNIKGRDGGKPHSDAHFAASQHQYAGDGLNQTLNASETGSKGDENGNSAAKKRGKYRTYKKNDGKVSFTTDPNKNSQIIRENTAGWKADAHKNLPGFRELYTRFPDAEWYVMLDDDTYMFFDNLSETLHKLNPDGLHYFGERNQFIGCGGYSEWGTSPGFAHGGSGIVMSRGTMLALIKGVDQCIIDYHDCWGGDVRTALCLRDQGVLVTHKPGFNHNGPDSDFWYRTDQCEKPISFHRLRNDQIQRLSTLHEKQARLKKHVTMSTVLGEFDPIDDIYENQDRPGGDQMNIEADSADDCRSRCASQPWCKSFVFIPNRCWLKSSIPPPIEREGAFSGIIHTNYQC